MKKKAIIAAAALILILFFPIFRGGYNDGGTSEYCALTYRIVKWKRLVTVYEEDGTINHETYKKTRVYWFPDNFKSIGELWEMEYTKE